MQEEAVQIVTLQVAQRHAARLFPVVPITPRPDGRSLRRMFRVRGAISTLSPPTFPAPRSGHARLPVARHARHRHAHVIAAPAAQLQDEAPGLLHQGKDRSTPVLLVRLQPPSENAAD